MAVTLTMADITRVAPELSDVADADVDAVIAYVQTEVSDSAWGSPERATRAATYLAAHLLSLARSGAGGGSIEGLSSVSIGGVSMSFDTSGAAGGQLSQTTYGQEYSRMLRLAPRRMAVL